MFVAVEGCCHGELDKIYETLSYTEQQNEIKIDLLLICGDFQAVRNKSDLTTMAVPSKYQKMNTFYKYYSQEKMAPVLTVFIGGNHEASNYLQELPYGGWVAPNIYYMGYAGVVQFGGLRIGGLSGIHKGQDYHKGHFECPPYDESTKRSVYHVRNLEVFRLKQLRQPLDIFLSHDWPRGVYKYGNVTELLRKKRFFAEEVSNGTLGSPAAEELLHVLKPAHWFSAHLHVKFPALIEFEPMADGAPRITKFLALDKCLPGREFLQVLEIHPKSTEQPKELHLDAEWLCILRSTNHLLSVGRGNVYMPGLGSSERYEFTVTKEDLESINSDFGQNLRIPKNFEQTADSFDGASHCNTAEPKILVNPQTTLLCEMVGVVDPFALFSGNPVGTGNVSSNSTFDTSLNNSDFIDSVCYNPDEISLDDLDEEENLDSGDDIPATLPPKKSDLSLTTSKLDWVSEQLQNLPPSMNSTKTAQGEQKFVSTGAGQKLGLTKENQKLVSCDGEQKLWLTDDNQKLISSDAEQKLGLTDENQKLVSSDAEQQLGLTDDHQKLVSSDGEQKLGLTDDNQKLVSSDAEQKLGLIDDNQTLVSSDAEQKLVLTDAEQNLVSADGEQKLESTDDKQKLVSMNTDQKSVPADGVENLILSNSFNSEAKSKEEVVRRTLKRRNFSIYGTKEETANDS